MKKTNILLVIIGITFLSIGIGGYLLTRGSENIQGRNYRRVDPIVGESISFGDDFFSNGYRMRGVNEFNQDVNNGEKFELDLLKEEVEDYIDRYDNGLAIADIFIYEDSEFYFSIVEESTGRGAMELLVNPYTKEVFPEFGPNMMWNLKYGMHNNGGMMGRGMMGNQRFGNRSGMMSGRGIIDNSYDDDYFNSNFTEDNEIDDKEAYAIGEAYLMENNNELTLGEEYHEFYGYYTFHIEKDGKPTGMLSVNGYTGEVWYHDWHGELIEIIEGHGDEDQ
ncbi:MAG: hypothetical protein K9L62_14525 [Vallitaleaceae bacterium]|nr:hypothetical protein [Vallitaleaceae bacterium]